MGNIAFTNLIIGNQIENLTEIDIANKALRMELENEEKNYR